MARYRLITSQHWCPCAQAELEKKVQREKALSEAEGRAKEARENEDINRRALTLRLEEERKKVVEAINTTFRCDSQTAQTLAGPRHILWLTLRTRLG